MTLEKLQIRSEISQDAILEVVETWELTTEQMLFMLSNHNAFEDAYAKDDSDFFEMLSHSPEFMAIFGQMTFDEAYDRYECMLEDGKA